MKYEFVKALKYGVVIKDQSFNTERGCYRIVLMKHNLNVYFFKYLNGEIVECCNLNKKKPMKEKNNGSSETVRQM